MRVLVTGGVRSGKSAHAESLLASTPSVIYIATGAIGDSDAEWTARIKAHQARRPAHWATIEDTDLPAVLAAVPNGSAVLLDSIGTWVTARLDALDAWETPRAHWEAQLSTDVDRAIAAFPAQAVLVSDEVGLGGIAAHPSSRLFADVLGEVNQRVATVCDEVHLVVAGRALRLSHLRAVAG